MVVTTYKLRDLPYALTALEPVISGQIMNLHYNKHHNAYVTNLNIALKTLSEAVASNNLVKQLEVQPTIKFNAGGHINHTLFWENLQPSSFSSSPESAAPELTEAIRNKWGSQNTFFDAFTATALGLQGSGWVWLVKSTTQLAATKSPELSIVTIKDQDIVPTGTLPVVGIDMWEHAYYLQYLNNKKDYVERVWQIVDWATAEKRFKGADVAAVYGSLSGLMGHI